MSTTTTSIPHYLNGTKVTADGGRFADVFNPSTGAVAAQVPLASTDDVAKAVETAKKAQQEWAAWNPQRRARVLMRFVDLVNKNADEIATTLSLEHGKTHADALGDIQRGIEVIEFAIGIPHLIKGEFTEAPVRASTCTRFVSPSVWSRASPRSTSRR